jgi:hypothetical protein
LGVSTQTELRPAISTSLIANTVSPSRIAVNSISCRRSEIGPVSENPEIRRKRSASPSCAYQPWWLRSDAPSEKCVRASRSSRAWKCVSPTSAGSRVQ